MQGTVAMFVIVLALLAGCRSMTGQSLGTNVDDKTTTATIKAKLVADQLQNLTWVDVDTQAGTVYLMGTASSQAQKQRAEEIARNTDGVKKVVNNIQVRAATSSSSASPSALPAASAATGRVTSIDRSTGRLTLATNGGDVTLNVPPSSLANIDVGDHVAIDVRKVR
jgi:hypothetical protein